MSETISRAPIYKAVHRTSRMSFWGRETDCYQTEIERVDGRPLSEADILVISKFGTLAGWEWALKTGAVVVDEGEP